MADEQRLFTASQSAQKVGIAYSTMRKHIQAGRVSADRKGRSLWITEAELRRSYPDAFSAIEDLKSADAATEGADPSANSAIESADASKPVTERDGSDIEVEVLRTKLIASEQQADHLRQQLDTVRDALQESRGEVEHLRALSTTQAENTGALTTEIQGLTAMLHTRRALPRPVGFLGRLFGRGDH
jgi:chromosome segregation ATPase